MANEYAIRNRRGTLLTTLKAGQKDDETTSLVLYGYGTSEYGEDRDQNLVYLLENFYSSTAPSNPVEGQLWWKSNDTLYIWTMTGSPETGIWRNVVPAANVLGFTILAGAGLTGGGFPTTSPAEVVLNVGDGAGIRVGSPTGYVSIKESEINHDNLSGFVANEHINHSSVTLTAGAGLTGGGNIKASRTFDVGAGDGILVNGSPGYISVDNTIFLIAGSPANQTTTGTYTVNSQIRGFASGSPANIGGGIPISVSVVQRPYYTSGREWRADDGFEVYFDTSDPPGSPVVENVAVPAADVYQSALDVNTAYPVVVPNWDYLYDGHPYSKFYWEVKIHEVSSRSNFGFGPGFGFGQSSAMLDSTAYSISIGDNSRNVTYDSYVSGGGILATGGSPLRYQYSSNQVAGDTINWAFDYANQKIWMGINGTWIGPGTQDPATGQGGFWPRSIGTNYLISNGTSAAMDYSPWATPEITGATGDKLEWKFSSSTWNYSPPTDFDNELLVHRSGLTASGSPATIEWVDEGGNAQALRTFTTGWAVVRGAGSTTTSYFRFYGATSGKRYAEFTMTGVGISNTTTYHEIGLTTAGDNFVGGLLVSQTGRIGFSLNTGAIRDSGNDPGNYITLGSPNYIASLDGRVLTASSASSHGDTVMIAVDYDNGRYYFGMNGTWFEGQDPTNPADGAPISAILGGSPNEDVLLSVVFRCGNQALLMNTGGTEFRFALPSGYQAYSGTTPGSPYAGVAPDSELAYTFINDDDTGILQLGGDTLGFRTGGVTRIQIDSSGLMTTVGSPYPISNDDDIPNKGYVDSLSASAGTSPTENTFTGTSSISGLTPGHKYLVIIHGIVRGGTNPIDPIVIRTGTTPGAGSTVVQTPGLATGNPPDGRTTTECSFIVNTASLGSPGFDSINCQVNSTNSNEYATYMVAVDLGYGSPI